MKILVTGGSGFIGGHIVEKLNADGHDVTVMDVKAPLNKASKFIKGDIVNKQDIERSVDNIDIIYHIAAFSNIDLVKDNPIKTIESNILGTAYLLEAARRKEVKRFIFASSVYVHDTRGHLYTTCKFASEMLCKNYYTLYGLPYTILRYGTAYGPRSRGADVISIFIQKALSNEEIVIHGSGNQKRNFVYVEDLALGSIAAMGKIGENKTYVIAGLESVSIKELVELLREAFSVELKIRIDSKKERRDDYTGEIDGLMQTMIDLKWKPETSLSDGIKKAREYYLRSERIT